MSPVKIVRREEKEIKGGREGGERREGEKGEEGGRLGSGKRREKRRGDHFG